MCCGNTNVDAKNLSEIALGFEDLSDYALLDVFDTLELEELLHLAEMNCRFRELITRYYMINRFHIQERMLKVGAQLNDGLFDLSLFNETKIEFDHNSIMINDHIVLLRFLRNFGHLIPNILLWQLEDGTANSSV